jgi:small-conductance mechanosensitive channel
MNETRVNLASGLEAAWTTFMLFLPKFLMFLGILIIGYFLAKLAAKLLDAVLERVGFDNMVERGGVKRALQRSGYDASDLLAKLLFYFVFLFVLQLAFGVFGQNPVSDLLTRVVAFLPNVFVALVIVIVAAAIAKGVKEMVRVALGTLSYGRYLANIASAAVMVIGVFAALNQLGIAPAIVNGLFYAMLAIVVGSAVIAIGGGGIAPMRGQWERWMGRLEQESDRIRAATTGAEGRITALKDHTVAEAERRLAGNQ